jgi:hypothetical protein
MRFEVLRLQLLCLNAHDVKSLQPGLNTTASVLTKICILHPFPNTLSPRISCSLFFSSIMSTSSKHEGYTYTPNLPQRALIRIFQRINKLIPWHKLPTYIGVLNVSAFRYELRQKNLHDVYPSPTDQGTKGCPVMTDNQYLHTRHSDGLFNDLEAPKMGCTGMRFGRNVPREFTAKPSGEELMRPNPRLISEELLRRDKFKPATSLNLLAAAWIQLVCLIFLR